MTEIAAKVKAAKETKNQLKKNHAEGACEETARRVEGDGHGQSRLRENRRRQCRVQNGAVGGTEKLCQKRDTQKFRCISPAQPRKQQ